MTRIAIIGSGIVGQATGKGLLTKGHSVVFSDINPKTIFDLKRAGHEAIFTDKLAETDASVLFFSVSTPTLNGGIQLGFLESAVTRVAETYLKTKDKYLLLVVRSTVPPGTTEEILIPILEKYSGKKAGMDFGVCMNPEYLREISNVHDFQHPWIVVIGELDKRSGDLLEEVYGSQECPVYRVDLRIAEMQKYTHNIFNACKISFFNEMRNICERIGINAEQVFSLVAKSAEASWNPVYGIKDLGPFGGSCLPKDTSAFLEWANAHLGESMVLLDAVIKVNNDLMEKQARKEISEEILEKAAF